MLTLLAQLHSPRKGPGWRQRGPRAPHSLHSVLTTNSRTHPDTHSLASRTSCRTHSGAPGAADRPRRRGGLWVDLGPELGPASAPCPGHAQVQLSRLRPTQPPFLKSAATNRRGDSERQTRHRLRPQGRKSRQAKSGRASRQALSLAAIRPHGCGRAGQPPRTSPQRQSSFPGVTVGPQWERVQRVCMVASLQSRFQGNPSRTGRGRQGSSCPGHPRSQGWGHLSSLPARELEVQWPSPTLGQSKAPRWTTWQPGWGPLSVPVSYRPHTASPAPPVPVPHSSMWQRPQTLLLQEGPPSLGFPCGLTHSSLRGHRALGATPRVPGSRAYLHPRGRTCGPHLPGAVPGRETRRGGCWDRT